MAKKRKKKIKVAYKSLGRSKAWGLAYLGEDYVEIDKSLKNKRLLKVLIHEIGHNIFPDMSENQILKLERIMGDTLWQEGFRKIEV